ncbi:MAG TPA: AAA family ATPase [Ktedonobacteraceae bacterium]|jgi:thymidylate kinase|nr:AAA family ATPase [Ktedonobacteraceae bacterium]
MKLFILGLPGSGKSAVARYLQAYLASFGLSTVRFNDYGILYQMYQHDRDGLFQHAEPGGFDVVNIVAFDLALRRLEELIKTYQEQAQHEFIIIEFSRNDYKRALSQFSSAFLEDACFLYLGTSVKECQQRIAKRAITKDYPADDYPISEYIFDKYYDRDDGNQLLPFLKNELGIDEQRIRIFENAGTIEELYQVVKDFTQQIIEVRVPALMR